MYFYEAVLFLYDVLTVNVVIFAGGKFRENVGKTFHVGVIFTILSYFVHKAVWALFSRGGNFREEDKSAKNAKIIPTRNFPRLQNSFCTLTVFIKNIQLLVRR